VSHISESEQSKQLGTLQVTHVFVLLIEYPSKQVVHCKAADVVQVLQFMSSQATQLEPTRIYPSKQVEQAVEELHVLQLATVFAQASHKWEFKK